MAALGGELIPLAHPGHWLLDLLYVVPVLIVVGFIAVRAILDRRAEANEAKREPAPPPAGDPPG